MADCRNYSKEFLTEFIELYKSHPCLWKTKSKDYMNRNKKNNAYKILVEKWKEVEKTATQEMVKTKINSLRSGFRRETKKIVQSKRSGAGQDDIYIPHLWYYDLLLFLRDQDMPRSSVSNVPNDDVDNEHSDSDQGEDSENKLEPDNDGLSSSIQSPLDSQPSTSYETHGPDLDTEEFTSPVQSPLDSRPSSRYGTHGNNSSTPLTRRATKKRRVKTVDQTDEVLALVTERLSHNNDQFTIYGNNIAAKLRTLPRETRLYTEKLINDLLFEAEMGRVTKATKIVSPLDSTANSPQVTLNRDASVHSYYYPHPNTYPLQIVPPQQHMSQNSFHTYSFQKTQDIPPITQVPSTQSLPIPSSNNNSDGISIQQSDNELSTRDNLASFLTNFQSN